MKKILTFLLPLILFSSCENVENNPNCGRLFGTKKINEEVAKYQMLIESWDGTLYLVFTDDIKGKIEWNGRYAGDVCLCDYDVKKVQIVNDMGDSITDVEFTHNCEIIL